MNIKEKAVISTRYRILVAECGQETGRSHRVAGTLRDSGIEVIYMGATFDADALCNAAIQEDVDAVVLSGVSDEHAEMLSVLSAIQHQRNVEDIPFLGVGSCKATAAPTGLKAVFRTEEVSSALIEWIRKEAKSEK